MARITDKLIYPLLFILPWQTRLILRPGRLDGQVLEYGQIGIFATEILLLVIIILRASAALGGASREARQKLSSRLLSKNNFLLLSFLILLVYYLFVSSDKLLTLQTFLYYLSALALFFVLKSLGPKEKTSAALAFIYGVALQAALGIYQFLTQSTFANRFLGLVPHEPWLAGAAVLENSAGRFLRAYGGLPHPNILGGYLVVSLLWLFFLLRKSSSFSPIQRALLWGAYLLQATALFFTFSRSAWLALVAAGLIAVITKQIHRAVILPFLVLFIIFSVLFQPLLVSRFVSTDRLEAASKNERINQYSEAWQIIKKNPWLGAGPGLYTLARHRLEPTTPIWTIQPVHNIFVLALAEWGIVGSGLVVLAIFFATRSILPFRNTRVPLVIALIIIGFFDHYLLSLWSGLLLAVILGLTVQGVDNK